jgi:hypothetical protein
MDGAQSLECDQLGGRQDRQGCLLPHLLFSRQAREHRFCTTTSNQQQAGKEGLHVQKIDVAE